MQKLLLKAKQSEFINQHYDKNRTEFIKISGIFSFLIATLIICSIILPVLWSYCDPKECDKDGAKKIFGLYFGIDVISILLFACFLGHPKYSWDLEDISDIKNLIDKIKEEIKYYIDTNIIDDEDDNKIVEVELV